MKTIVRIICVLLVMCGILALASCKDDGTGDKNTDGTQGTDNESEVKYKATEGLLVYYIYRAAYEFTEEDLIEHNFDAEKSLKDQMYDDGHTWYDILVERAADNLTALLVWCNAAADDGVELDSGDYQQIEGVLIQQRITAAAEGYTLDDYLANIYNNTYITEAVLQAAYEFQHLSQKYSRVLEERFDKSLTEEMVAEQLGKDGSTDTTLTRNLGIIVLSADKYGSIESAAAQAEKILGQLKEEQPTYERFEEYALQHSDSSDIYYKNVAKGDMLSEIDEWLYSAETRKIGDMDVIVSDYGANIIYYESDGDPVNVANAKVKLVDKMFEDWFDQIKGKYGTLVPDGLIDALELDF
ncbi:MAG TPA: hypothetical protein GX011_04715 [Clostridiales bacterium]|nr:hypothetical protein [Clostridiales bacterium]